jgi:hypothetical protein
MIAITAFAQVLIGFSQKMTSISIETYLDTGLPVCSKMACFANLRKKRNLLPTMRHVSMAEYDSPEFKCTPTEFFKLECNTCKCGADGKSVTRCTKKTCIDGE